MKSILLRTSAGQNRSQSKMAIRCTSRTPSSQIVGGYIYVAENSAAWHYCNGIWNPIRMTVLVHGRSPANTTSRTELRVAIDAVPEGGSAALTLPGASCYCDYDSQIEVGRNVSISIFGNGAVLDAWQRGRFLNVSAPGASITLDSLTDAGHLFDCGGFPCCQCGGCCSVFWEI